MATVTGLTAERMLVMESETVVDGEVQGDNLILITRAGTEIDAGNVRGPVGPQGPAVAAGIITATISATPDQGFVFLNGTIITDGQTLYPNLWAKIPSAWKSGANILLPDARGKMLVGADATLMLGALAGSAALTIAAANLPPHIHAVDHDHPNTTVSVTDPGHTHGQAGHYHAVYQDSSGAGIEYIYLFNGGSPGANALVLHGTGGEAIVPVTNSAAPTIYAAYTGITAAVNLPNFVGNSGNGGFTNTPVVIPTPPSLVVNWQIKT